MNKLAAVEEVIGIKEIVGADRIELVQVLGFQSVVKKGEFKIGDKIIFVFPDTTIGKQPWNEFLFKAGDGDRARVRTIRLKGEVSQGIVFPVSILNGDVPEVGLDVSERIGVEKWERPLPEQLRGKAKGNRPYYVPETGEYNVQSYPKTIFEMQGKACVATLKMDGSSGSYFFRNGVFGVTSRCMHWEYQPKNVFWKIAERYDIENKLKLLSRNIVIQGEVCSPGIQKNKIGLSELSFYGFDIYDIDKMVYLPHDEALSIFKSLDIPTVKEVARWDTFNLSLDDLIALSNAQNYPNGGPAEGIVVRLLNGGHSKVLRSRLSVKVMNQRFEEKYRKS